MIGEIKDALGKIAKDRVVVGFDLSDEFSQISYCKMSDNEPQTISVVLGSEEMCIPTKLGKFYGENTWTFGVEAEKLEANNEGFLIRNLIALARAGAPVEVETRDYDPVDLLALFMKKCFSLLSLTAPIEKVSAIMITVDKPDAEMISLLTKAIKTLRIKPEKVYFQSHSESVYHYVIHQNRDLWNHDVLVCHIKEEGLYVRALRKNVNTSPVVMLMEEENFPHIKAEQGEGMSPGKKKEKDKAFCRLLMDWCEGRYVSSVYLLGDGFSGEWFPESLQYMCRNRRVFLGNNLFSKGACYGAKAKLEQTEEEKGYVFLGKDKVKANVGMHVVREGEEVYMALLDAGKNWYETMKECDLILDRTDELDFIVTPLNGKNVRTVPMYLTGCPARPPKATRIHLEMKMVSARKLYVCVTDMGFGELYVSSGLQWKSEITID